MSTPANPIAAWTPVDESAAAWTPVDEKKAPEKPGAVSRFATSFGQMLGMPERASDYLEGPYQAVRHPVNSAKLLLGAMAQSQQEVIDKAYQAQHSPGLANKAEGLVRGLYSALPVVGPALNRAGEQFQQGDVAGGLGSTAGIAVPAVAGELAPKGLTLKAPSKLAGAASERLYQSALKPSTTYGTEKVGSIVQTGLENNIPVSQAGMEKLANLVGDLNDKISAQIQAGQQAGQTISRKAVAGRLLDTAERFKNQVAPQSDLQTIKQTGQEFYETQPAQIDVAKAQQVKVGTYQQLRGKYGELSSARIESEKALARGIKEELEKQFPEIKGLNAQEAKLINLDQPLELAVARINNRQLLGIGTPIAAAAGGAVGGGPGAVAMAVLKAAMDDPIVKSKLAIMISKAGKGITIPAANARVAGYAAALTPKEAQ